MGAVKNPNNGADKGSGELRRPNILLFMTDQQRHDQMGYSSGGYFETTNLDMLAGNGVIFETAYSYATTCIPSRGSILSGLRPGRYPTQGFGMIREGFWNAVQELRRSGYQTAVVGEMHLYPIHAAQGFEYMRMAEHLGMGYGPPHELDDYTMWLVTEGKADWRATHMFGADDAEAHRHFIDNLQAVPFAYDRKYHPTSWIMSEAVKFLENREDDRPFFLIVSFKHPHSPFDPPAPYDTLYDPEDLVIPLDGLEVNENLPPAARGPMLDRKGFGYCAVSDVGEEKSRRVMTYIRALIKQIDDAIGEILKRVDMDNTVVMFTSDHGDYYGHRGLLFKTPGIPFDDISRVPLFLSGKGIPSGIRVKDCVQSADLALTWLDIAGIKKPADVFDTQSLLRYFGDGDSSRPGDRVVYCSSNYHWPMMRYKNIKYFRHIPTGQEMLFDLEKDPGESVNLADDPDYKDVLDDLRYKMTLELAKGIPDLPAFDR